MPYIYCIEDINDLKYVGLTTRKINIRLIEHRYDKKTNKKKCSSKLLDLNNCEIIVLEECEESNKKEREKYWINKIDCVNKYDLTFDVKEYDRKRNQTEKRRERRREYHHENKIIRNKKRRDRFHYVNSWGGDPRRNNNLLKIDISLFT